MELTQFCLQYNISREAFYSTGLEWNELQNISRNFSQLKPALESVGKYVVEALLKCGKVHSINYRIKQNDHLIEKIIRKTIADPSRRFTIENYRTEITDLLGIRILHLFKEDWKGIHDFITSTWELAERPIAYVRPGDLSRMGEYYYDSDCEVREHKYGYRSVHYVIKSRPDRETYLVEIQARTIFEEAWGEIDHVVRYPYHTDNEFLVKLSSILNRLSANADELGSYMRYLKNRMDMMEFEHQQALQEKNELIDTLRRKINELEIDKDKKEEINISLSELEQNRRTPIRANDKLPWMHAFMESDLFKGFATQIDKFVNSEHFKPLEISEADIEMIEKTQKELVQFIRDPENMKRLLHDPSVSDLIARLEDTRPQEER